MVISKEFSTIAKCSCFRLACCDVHFEEYHEHSILFSHFRFISELIGGASVMEGCLLSVDREDPSLRADDVTIWNFMEVNEALTSALTLRELLRWLHDPKRHATQPKRRRSKLYCCAHAEHNENGFKPVADWNCTDENSNFDFVGHCFDSCENNNNNSTMDNVGKRHKNCVHFELFKICNCCFTCQSEIKNQNQGTDGTYQSLKEKQKNDRETIRQKLCMGDPDVDSVLYGSDKPWYQPRLERSMSGHNQNLQICYINDSCSSSDNEEGNRNGVSESKTSPSFNSSGAKSSPTSSPVLSSPGFGIRKNFTPFRMSSSSSTMSLSSTSSAGHHTSSSSIPGDGEIISIRSSLPAEVSKPKTKQEELELQARIAITQAHQEARRKAEEDRLSRRESEAAHTRLLPLDDTLKMKVKTKSLTNGDCSKMTVGQLQVILNEMHAEKEVLNSELMLILETRDDLKMEQDAKLVDIEDVKAMMSVTGPETTV